jgi:activator of HSP90 ATPase
MSQVHQEVTFAVSPDAVYRALIQSDRHAAFTGAPTEINGTEGGAFSCYGGRVIGRNVELVENQRIVQAWRPANWAEGVYSIVRIQLASEGGTTRLTLDHDGIPDASVAGIDAGWTAMYWEPLRKYLES